MPPCTLLQCCNCCWTPHCQGLQDHQVPALQPRSDTGRLLLILEGHECPVRQRNCQWWRQECLGRGHWHHRRWGLDGGLQRLGMLLQQVHRSSWQFCRKIMFREHYYKIIRFWVIPLVFTWKHSHIKKVGEMRGGSAAIISSFKIGAEHPQCSLEQL